MTEFQRLGEWFFPDEPTKRVPGTLEIKNGYPELWILDSLEPITGPLPSPQESRRFPVLHGIEDHAQAITLFDVQRVKYNISIGSAAMKQPERLVATMAVVGVHAQLGDCYESARFRVPGLELWMANPLTNNSIEHFNSSGEEKHLISIGVVPNENLTATSLDTTVRLTLLRAASGSPFSSLTVTVTAWMEIRPTQSQTIDWYLEQHEKLGTLLALLAGTSMAPDKIFLQSRGKSASIELIVPLRNSMPCKYKNHYDFLTLRSSLGMSFEKVVNKWLELHPSIEIPGRLAVSVLSSSDLWIHVRFLSLIHALEGLHRALFEGNYMPQIEYQKVVGSLTSAIPSCLSPDHKDALRSRIKYGYQHSLAKRMNDLAAKLPSNIRVRVLGATGEFPRSWIETRNYYTHWDESLRPYVLDASSMHRACVRMAMMLRMLYLSILGVPLDALNRALSSTNEHAQELVMMSERSG